jgi:hypothetical protein
MYLNAKLKAPEAPNVCIVLDLLLTCLENSSSPKTNLKISSLKSYIP